MQRIFEIHSEIRKGELPNCSTLAASMGVTRKTIQRDINFMRDGLGLPLVYCDDLHGYRYDGDVSDFPVFEIENLNAKGTRVEVRFEVGRLEEVVRWVLSFGRQAKVIAPPELIRLVSDEVRAMQGG